MGKRYRSTSRAVKRGHLSFVFDDLPNNKFSVMIVHNYKRFGKPNRKNVYMQLGAYQRDAVADPQTAEVN